MSVSSPAGAATAGLDGLGQPGLGLTSGNSETRNFNVAFDVTRDPFKAIDYLFAATGGLGYKVADSDTTKFSVDGGGGVTWEKNPGIDTRTYGAIVAGEDFSHKLSQTASITEGIHALWKADDFGDALYTFGMGLAATVTTKTAVKVDLLDTLKTKPPAGVKENDLALLVSLAYKF